MPGKRNRTDSSTEEPVVEYHRNNRGRTERWFIDGKPGRANDLPAEIKYRRNVKEYEVWFINGVIGRANDLPAWIIYREDGTKHMEQWAINGAQGRANDLPAEIEYNQNGTKEVERWYNNDGKPGRANDLPALIRYRENGTKKREQWFINGDIDRANDLPALIEYRDDDTKKVERWYINGVVGRANDLPALILYHRNGTKDMERWFINGAEGRANDLPAVIFYREDGTKESEQWYINGVVGRANGRPTTIRYNPDGTVAFQQQQQRQPPLATRGNAVQVHDAFEELNHARLAELLGDGGSVFGRTTTIRGDLQEMIDNPSVVPDAAERAELRRILNAQRNHLAHIPGAVARHAALFSAALRYARLQPPAFQRAYLKNFLQDCVQAYDSVRFQSCTRGVWERLVFALGQAAALDGAQDDAAAGVSPEQRAEYSALAAVLFPLDFNQLKLRVRAFMSNCFNESSDALNAEGATEDEKRTLIRDCVVSRINAVPSLLEIDRVTLDRAIDEELHAVHDMFINGGGRRVVSAATRRVRGSRKKPRREALTHRRRARCATARRSGRRPTRRQG